MIPGYAHVMITPDITTHPVFAALSPEAREVIARNAPECDYCPEPGEWSVDGYYCPKHLADVCEHTAVTGWYNASGDGRFICADCGCKMEQDDEGLYYPASDDA